MSLSRILLKEGECRLFRSICIKLTFIKNFGKYIQMLSIREMIISNNYLAFLILSGKSMIANINRKESQKMFEEFDSECYFKKQ